MYSCITFIFISTTFSIYFLNNHLLNNHLFGQSLNSLIWHKEFLKDYSNGSLKETSKILVLLDCRMNEAVRKLYVRYMYIFILTAHFSVTETMHQYFFLFSGVKLSLSYSLQPNLVSSHLHEVSRCSSGSSETPGNLCVHVSLFQRLRCLIAADVPVILLGLLRMRPFNCGSNSGAFIPDAAFCEL